MPIQYIGLNKLDDTELSKLKTKSERFFNKIERKLKNSTIIISVKKYNQKGKRVKYSLHARVDSPSIRVAAQADDWDLAKATHKIFSKLETETLHKFKI